MSQEKFEFTDQGIHLRRRVAVQIGLNPLTVTLLADELGWLTRRISLSNTCLQ